MPLPNLTEKNDANLAGRSSDGLPASARALSSRRGQLLATLLCFAFSIAFILNIHPTGDGLWFWYAVLWRDGKKLYADMHLPLQPLFVLLTAWTQVLLGKGWLAGKVLAAAQAAVYCVGLYLVAGYSRWRDWEKALVIPAAFGLSLTSFYSRFDDYHITGYIFEVWSVYLLLRLMRKRDAGNELWIAGLLGLLSGLSVANRLNDGAALFAACALVLPFCIARRKLLSLTIFSCATPLALLVVILLTGDTVRDWAVNSIFHAAAIKGGTENVLTSPLGYPLRLAREVRHNGSMERQTAYVLGLIAIAVLMVRYGRSHAGRISGRSLAVWITGITVLAAATWRARHYFEYGAVLNSITMFCVPLVFLLSLWLFGRVLLMVGRRQARGWDPRPLLMLVPVLQIPGTTLSSRGGPSVLEVFPQIAILFLVLPVAVPERMWRQAAKTAYVTVAGFLIATTALAKTWHPYYWHHFADRRMFVGRVWYRHPIYGPMYIQRDNLNLMQALCSEIGQDGAPKELLSITNPYANYFCNVVPWHGYVQTWYDTTSKQTIDTLMGELSTAPPKWIIYQRALDSIKAHEEVFNAGKPIPHRALDALIVHKIESGQWHIAGWHKLNGADWIVIKTHP